MSPESRRQLLLGVLILLLIVFGGRLLLQLGSPAGGGAAGRRGGASAGMDSGPLAVEVVELRLEDLRAEGGRYRPGRDPFRYGERPAPPSPPPRPVQSAPVADPTTVEVSAPAPPPAPQPPPVDVVFLGSFGPRDLLLAVFSDGQEIFNVFEGDVLKEKFIVRQVGYESVDLGFVGFPGTPPQRLAIGG